MTGESTHDAKIARTSFWRKARPPRFSPCGRLKGQLFRFSVEAAAAAAQLEAETLTQMKELKNLNLKLSSNNSALTWQVRAPRTAPASVWTGATTTRTARRFLFQLDR